MKKTLFLLGFMALSAAGASADPGQWQQDPGHNWNPNGPVGLPLEGNVAMDYWASGNFTDYPDLMKSEYCVDYRVQTSNQHLVQTVCQVLRQARTMNNPGFGNPHWDHGQGDWYNRCHRFGQDGQILQYQNGPLAGQPMVSCMITKSLNGQPLQPFVPPVPSPIVPRPRF